MRNILSIFFSVHPVRAFAVIGSLFLSNVLEGLGLASLLPIVSLATEQNASDSPAQAFIVRITESFGLEPSIGSFVVFLVTALVFKSVIAFVALSFVGYTAAEVATKLRFNIIQNLLNVRWRYLVENPLGRITNTVGNDSTRAANAYETAAGFIAMACQAIVLTIVALVVSWKLTLAAFAMGGLMVLALQILVRISRHAGDAQTRRTRELVVLLSDTLANLKVIRAMNRQAPYANLLNFKITKVRNALRRQVLSREAVANFQDAATAIFLGVAFFVLYTRFMVPLAELLVSGIIVSRTVGSIGKLQKSYQKAVLLESAFIAVDELIDATGADPEPPRGQKTPTFSHIVRFENLSFAYDQDTVLDKVNLHIRMGELTVLMGPSGSGKSTILDLLFGLYRPTSGKLTIDGDDIATIDLKAWRNLLGYVPQDVSLLHDTIQANITLGETTITDEEIWTALRKSGVATAIEELPDGLMTIVGERGSRFSGGQRQRLALARAIVRKPALLVLDEVTSALDQATASMVAAEIRALVPETTILAVTHRPEFLEVADTIYRIENGRAELQEQVAA